MPTVVTEQQGLAYRCPYCRKVHYAPMPEAVVKAGLFGPRLTALFEAQLALRFGGKCPAWVVEAKAFWRQMNKNLPDFPRGGDNTPWVAKKQLQTVLDTPMNKERYDKNDPRGTLLKEWPTSDGTAWVNLQ